MSSNRLRHGSVDEFDRIVREALCESIRSEEPSAHVRAAMLRAAAAGRARPAWRSDQAPDSSHSWATVESMVVHLPRVRFVL
jgi:hypothetical protein